MPKSPANFLGEALRNVLGSLPPNRSSLPAGMAESLEILAKSALKALGEPESISARASAGLPSNVFTPLPER